MKPIKLGEINPYPSTYDPNLLELVERKQSRQKIQFNAEFYSGSDLWTCYEFSWLDTKRLPKRSILTIEYDMNSAHIIESKSLKYYLFSFSNAIFKDEFEAKEKLTLDLSNTLNSQANVLLNNNQRSISISNTVELLDNLDIEINKTDYDRTLLKSEKIQTRQIVLSSLLKSNCPITGQPDWATVFISIDGKIGVNKESLLQYIISFRNQHEFHEQCVERIISDIRNVTNSKNVTVYARYSRRGGIDINPLRYCGKICPDIEYIYNQNKLLKEIDLYQ